MSEPGKELDAEVAEKVMGIPWRFALFGSSGRLRFLTTDDRYARAAGDEPVAAHQHHVPHYSTDIAAAMLVVEKLHRHPVMILRFGKGEGVPDSEVRQWHVDFSQHDAVMSDSLPHAICVAALKACASLPSGDSLLPNDGRASGGSA